MITWFTPKKDQALGFEIEFPRLEIGCFVPFGWRREINSRPIFGRLVDPECGAIYYANLYYLRLTLTLASYTL